jgi:ferredoxin-NADP reductase/predicted pyridoxine 5'-phosphate oxidase superfamily flavin-nucleotide-binding protein
MISFVLFIIAVSTGWSPQVILVSSALVQQTMQDYAIDDGWHRGEKLVQQQLHGEELPFDNPTQSFMPKQHQTFFSDLEYFFLGSLDEHGRPWASVVTGKRGFMHATDPHHLKIVTNPIMGDPIVSNLQQGIKHDGSLVAGLGIDFTNRRRNKVAGRVPEDQFHYNANNNTLSLGITTEQSIGNCPKYITIRKLQYVECAPTKSLQELNAQELSAQVLPTIEQASTIFVATRHLDDDIQHMGFNHRGGPPGFARYNDGKIYWPDYSGNRMYQSLGNIATDPVAGLLFPDFETGNVLYVTGDARNVFGEEAKAIMPNVRMITEVLVTGYVYIEGGLPIRSQESLSQFSPYNPTVAYLLTEKNRHIVELPSTIATLTHVDKITPTISTFHFTTSSPISYQPGQHVIMDFNSVIVKEYHHMNDSDPSSLNDNLLRSWTITSPPHTNSFELTIRKQHHISMVLHQYKSKAKLKVLLRGIGGNFAYDGSDAIFIAAGIGVTPFVSFLKQKKLGKIALLLSYRSEDENLRSLYDASKVEEHVFITDKAGRMKRKDIEMVSDYKLRQLYICGPTPFMKQIYVWAQELGIDRVFSEEFNF